MRLTRDLLAPFWFVEPAPEFDLEVTAWAWWRKVMMVRSGMAGPGQDWEIEAGRVRRALPVAQPQVELLASRPLWQPMAGDSRSHKWRAPGKARQRAPALIKG